MNVSSNYREEELKSQFQVHLTNEIGNSTLTVEIFRNERILKETSNESKTAWPIAFLVLGIFLVLIIIALILAYLQSKYREEFEFEFEKHKIKKKLSAYTFIDLS